MTTLIAFNSPELHRVVDLRPAGSNWAFADSEFVGGRCLPRVCGTRPLRYDLCRGGLERQAALAGLRQRARRSAGRA